MSSGRRHIAVTGRVQGVGFRYHVVQLARQLGLVGYVRNTPTGVAIEVEGDIQNMKSFLISLEARPPRQASIQSFEVTSRPLRGDKDFYIDET
ncbi:hypothetical protein A3C17_01845 [Candidatus Uhrbacteria bacterium RIFCSPHIGHO2_02_FULL_53_13]|uniref:acylphosphatase n=1 Tax=Candidatus Uhrbacteria bacterium RIFCSPHIGHO2_02_FULL_53_13 TaxID=1802389 RepID=A0A1F7U2F9_9BACT|nr:MAG: hypothetical protein A3C17_01845 [Candidatus Uhrbacteria bacterium RIFCSPHIGHO2_02_FULL_53_13]